MNREIIPFTTEEKWLADRSVDLTSTDVAALFGVSPYCTRFELYWRKQKGFVTPHPENNRQSWGKILQGAIAQGVAAEHDYLICPMTEYVRIPDAKLGSSFDFRIVGEENKRGGRVFKSATDEPRDDDAVLECKNVDGLIFRQGWIETDFGIEAPVHIEAQLQHQLLVSGLSVGYIAALVGGNRLHVLRREADPATHARILEEAHKFWTEGEPEPDFHRDATFISQLYARSDGTVATADAEVESLVREYMGYKATASAASDNADAIKAQVLRKIGATSKILGESFTLHCEERAPVEVAAHTRKGFRNFRSYPKGEKK